MSEDTATKPRRGSNKIGYEPTPAEIRAMCRQIKRELRAAGQYPLDDPSEAVAVIEPDEDFEDSEARYE